MRNSMLVVAALLGLSACTAGSSPEPSASALPSASRSASAMPSLPPVPGTIGEDGTTLWAPLAPGRYATTLFQPRLSFVVVDGWFSVDADFMLNLTRDDGYFSSFAIYRWGGNVTADRCSTPERVEELADLNELIEWVASYEGLEVTELVVSGRPPMTIGGYPARILDIAFAGGQRCPGDKVVDGVSHSVAMLWTGEVGEILSANERIRAIFIEHPDGPLIISLRTLPAASASHDLQSKVLELEELIELAQPVLESIEFPPPAN